MVLSADTEMFGPAPPWPPEELLDAGLVRRLRSRVARQLADTQRERERRAQARLPGADQLAASMASSISRSRRRSSA